MNTNKVLAIVSSTLAGDRLTLELQQALEKKGVSIKPSFMITRKEIRPSEFQVSCPSFFLFLSIYLLMVNDGARWLMMVMRWAILRGVVLNSNIITR